MIRVENVWYSYDGTTYVLKGVSLEVRAGELVCIMGPNGSGKTTLVRIMSGLVKPTRGRVLIGNVDVNQATKEAKKPKIGVVFQNPDHQIFSETVKEEILFSLKAVGVKERDARRRMEEALRRLGIEGLKKKNPLTLSEGEKKLVTLATIIAINPEIIIMDEPTAGQDWLNKKIIDGVVREAVSGGRSVIIVTHDVEFCAELDARVIILYDGKIVIDGEAEKVLSNFEVLEKTGLRPPVVAELISKLMPEREMGNIPVKVDDAVSLILEKRCKAC